MQGKPVKVRHCPATVAAAAQAVRWIQDTRLRQRTHCPSRKEALRWNPLPLTVEEGQTFAARLAPDSEPQAPGSELASEVSATEAILQVEKLTYAYGSTPVLHGVSLTVGAGELVTLMGRNGSGKTTVLNCITGLLKPQQGSIALAGRSLL